jgi:hypothetical protein
MFADPLISGDTKICKELAEASDEASRDSAFIGLLATLNQVFGGLYPTRASGRRTASWSPVWVEYSSQGRLSG